MPTPLILFFSVCANRLLRCDDDTLQEDDNARAGSNSLRESFLVALVPSECETKESQVLATNSNISACRNVGYILVVFGREVTRISYTLELRDEGCVNGTYGRPVHTCKEGMLFDLLS